MTVSTAITTPTGRFRWGDEQKLVSQNHHSTFSRMTERSLSDHVKQLVADDRIRVTRTSIDRLDKLFTDADGAMKLCLLGIPTTQLQPNDRSGIQALYDLGSFTMILDRDALENKLGRNGLITVVRNAKALPLSEFGETIRKSTIRRR